MPACCTLCQPLCLLHSEEAEEYIEIGALNGLFVLGRSMGFIGKNALYACMYCGRMARAICMYCV